MMNSRRSFLASASAVALLGPRVLAATAEAESAPASEIAAKVDWRSFLERHDLVWNRMPRIWGEAPFLGNGRLALSVMGTADGQALAFTIDNVDVYDRRDLSWGWVAYSRARYHVGDFHLVPAGKINGLRMRLSLHDAELTGEVATDRGTIRFRALVPADEQIILVDLETTGEEEGCTWVWKPAEAVSTRPPVRTAEDQAKYKEQYGQPVRIWVDNPGPERHDREDLGLHVQRLLAGGAYTTAWRERASPGSGRTLFIGNSMSFPDVGSIERAEAAVRRAEAAGLAALRTRHRKWWHDYYPRSFLSLPDARLESFYWIQMYKYGCVAGEDVIIDTHGPWLQRTNWPYLTWNLNVQLSYYALQPSNRLPLAEGLFRALDSNPQTLRENARPFGEPGDIAVLGHCSQHDLFSPLDQDLRYVRQWGNLLWVCHLYWLQYRYSMDHALLANRLFPLLKRAVNFYLPKLSEETDGRLHLPETYSPETGTTRDCNYDLSLLKWACSALVEASSRLKRSDPMLATWRRVIERLAPFPKDEDGYRVGADLGAPPHRHFSHLMMIYPLYLETVESSSDLELLNKSADHWLSTAATTGEASGFTYASGSSMYASLQRGNDALTLLQGLFNREGGIGKIFPNTMYAESGQNIESPLAAAQAIHDMLLQSWGGVIRVYPAMPDSWRDCVFHDLRAEGAFLVSARRSGGRAQWVRVKSLAGEPCILDANWNGELPLISGNARLRRLSANRYEIGLGKGEEAILRSPHWKESCAVAPLPMTAGEANSFGLP